MFIKLAIFLSAAVCCDSVYVYSSFWAPLFNPRILNYRVEAPFDPNEGIRNRDEYVKNYGVRGENLLADLGNGKGPPNVPLKQNAEAVKFQYTYPGADPADTRYDY